MRCLVTYSSKYGSAERYARWTAEALGCEVIDVKNVNAEMLKGHDVIIHGGGLYAGGLSGLNRIMKHYAAFPEKKFILFTCGLADPSDPAHVDHIEQGLGKVMKPEAYRNVKQFHFRGGIDYTRLNPIHKAMMAMLVKTMRAKGYDNLNSEDQLMLDTYGKQIDFSDKETILPLVEYVTSL